MSTINHTYAPRISGSTGMPVFGGCTVPNSVDAVARERVAAAAGFLAGATKRQLAGVTRPGGPPT